LPKNPYDFRDVASVLIGGPEKKKPRRDSRRAFNQTQKVEIFRRQKGKCAMCHKKLDFTLADFDHIKPFESGGKTTVRNGQALHKDCHAKKIQKERLKKVDKKRTRKPTDLFQIPKTKLPKSYL
jgi:5-methylcytosine-specific restriction endonuclease McrA